MPPLHALPLAAALLQLFSSLSGTIVDPLGAVLPAVTVTLTSVARPVRYQVETDSLGRYEFVGLPPGEFRLEAEVPGFQRFRATITVGSEAAQRPIVMPIGGLTETVTVSEDDPPASPPEAKAGRNNPPCPAASGAVAVGGNLRPPMRIRHVRAQYPEQLKGTGTRGAVVLDARIGLNGYLSDIVVREPAHPAFADALVAAVREWRFDSTLLNCVPQEVPITVHGNFLPRR